MADEPHFRLQAETSALIIVDMQNDFVRAGAPLEVPSARGTIETHRRLIAACRPLGVPVIYTKFIGGPRSTLVWNYDPIAEPICFAWRNYKRFYPDVGKELECTDIVDEIYPGPGDYIVEKYGYDAFYNTNLEDVLRANHSEYVIVTGTVTQICVESTAKAAFHRQLKAAVVADAVSSFDDELHRGSLRSFSMFWGRVMTSDQVLAELCASHSSLSKEA